MPTYNPNYIIWGLDYNNPIIWIFDAYFSLFIGKDPLLLYFYMKLLTNGIGPPTLKVA
jgi:hypothetical protein